MQASGRIGTHAFNTEFIFVGGTVRPFTAHLGMIGNIGFLRTIFLTGGQHNPRPFLFPRFAPRGRICGNNQTVNAHSFRKGHASPALNQFRTPSIQDTVLHYRPARRQRKEQGVHRILRRAAGYVLRIRLCYTGRPMAFAVSAPCPADTACRQDNPPDTGAVTAGVNAPADRCVRPRRHAFLFRFTACTFTDRPALFRDTLPVLRTMRIKGAVIFFFGSGCPEIFPAGRGRRPKKKASHLKVVAWRGKPFHCKACLQ